MHGARGVKIDLARQLMAKEALVADVPASGLVPLVAFGPLIFLAVLGMVGARANGADSLERTVRVTFWGAPILTI